MSRFLLGLHWSWPHPDALPSQNRLRRPSPQAEALPRLRRECGVQMMERLGQVASLCRQLLELL